MDLMGIASGVGGVGGALAIVGSQEGTATLWRFISSQFLPLRPRLRLGVQGVFLCEVVTRKRYTLNGIHLGSKALESGRGVPCKVCPMFDGRAVMSNKG